MRRFCKTRRENLVYFEFFGPDKITSCDDLLCEIAATLFSKKSKRKVILADKNFDRNWIPNYGVWKDEWESVGERYTPYGVDTLNCVDRKWNVTDCYFGGSFDIPTEERFRIDRPYFRVDRLQLQDVLSDTGFDVIKANHESKAIGLNMFSPADSLVHTEQGSIVTLSDGSVVNTKIIVDCTGHESKLIFKNPAEACIEAGYQIAYGMTAAVEPLDDSKVGILPISNSVRAFIDPISFHNRLFVFRNLQMK